MFDFKAIRPFIFQAIFAAMLLSCDPWASYSPFESQVDQALQGTTRKQLALIDALNTDDSRPFKIALVSDPHYHFSKLEDAVAQINNHADYAFVIVTGDLSENGLQQEFVYFYETMTKLNIPWLTVIGNHDYLANGERVYAQMFGPYNYSFVFNNVKFILFDNNTLESEKEPDLNWLRNELETSTRYDHTIPFSHIPPYDPQMKNHSRDYHDLMVRNKIRVSIHGHRHDFSMEESYGDGVSYVTVSSPQKRTYTELTISSTAVEVKKIEY